MTSGKATPTTQEPAADEFHKMIGYCIAEWAKVEDELFRICQLALRCPKEHAAIIYYRTPGLNARLTLTDELVRAVLPKHKAGAHPHADLKFWSDVLKQTQHLLPTRNRIAHHPVDLRSAAFYLDVSYLDVPPESWFEIYESQNEQLRAKSSDKSPLLVGDLRAHHTLTTGISNILSRFYYEKLAGYVAALPPPAS
jgi:hypothetical protein